MSSHILTPAEAPTVTSARPHSFGSRRTIAIVAAAAALVLVLAGGFLPWLTLFNGLTELRGFALDGGVLAFIALTVTTALFVQAKHGGARILRPLAVLGALAIVADSILSAARIAAYAAAPGPAGALTQPAPGVGPYLFAAAGVALLTAAVSAPAAPGRLGMRVALRLTLAVLLLAAGVVHLILTPEHLDAATILGLGFLAAGLAQLGLAGLTVAAPGRAEALIMYAIIVVNVALIAIYVYAVIVGLPIQAAHADDDAGLRIGTGEAVDLKGGIDLIAEIGAVGIAAFLALGRNPESPTHA